MYLQPAITRNTRIGAAKRPAVAVVCPMPANQRIGKKHGRNGGTTPGVFML